MLKRQINFRDNRPNASQVNYARDLVEQLGLEDNYNFTEIVENWTKQEVSDLIDHLKAIKERRG